MKIAIVSFRSAVAYVTMSEGISIFWAGEAMGATAFMNPPGVRRVSTRISGVVEHENTHAGQVEDSGKNCTRMNA